MATSAFLRGLLALAATVALVGTTASSSSAKRRDPHPPPVTAPDTLRPTPSAADVNALHLARAAAERRAGHARAVVEELESVDLSQPSFPDADRAAFLLGQVYLELGSFDRFALLARRVAAWSHPTPYTEWIAFQARLVASEGADPSTFPELAAADTSSALGRERVGAANIKASTQALRAGHIEEARERLAAVPAGSRYASRARHMLGVIALENMETERGTHILESLLAEDSTYAGRREVLLALAGQSMDEGAWDAAQERYRAIAADWTRNGDALRGMLADSTFEPLWASWQSNAAISGVLALDAVQANAAAGSLAASSTDLTTRPPAVKPRLDAPPAVPALRWPVAPPPAEERQAVAASAKALAESASDLERTRWEIARERETLDRLGRYYRVGDDRIAREVSELDARTARLERLKSMLDSLDAELRAVRDESSRRIVERTALVVEACTRSLRWIRAMRHFHVDGPERERTLPAPAGATTPESVLEYEEALTKSLQDAAERMGYELPWLIQRSYARAWRPNLIDRVGTLGASAHQALAWARALDRSVDSSIAATATSDELRRLESLRATLERSTDSLRVAHEALRDRVARQAVERALAALEVEREGIDYGLAASAYGLAVRLGRPRTTDSTRAGADSTADETTTDETPRVAVSRSSGGAGVGISGSDEEPDDPEQARWRAEAIAAFRTFLERHPESPARGEMRFRLADLELVEARKNFQEQMARYLRNPSSGAPTGPLPVLSYSDALDLYRAILKDDRQFEHIDAVLFNAGMILADEGSGEADRYFDELVSGHPGSPYCQEAYLRMGDMRFNAKRYADCVGYYQMASTGRDSDIRAIALYKMGWAQYNGDRYRDAADAFRSVLDLYERDSTSLHVDIRREAESYLVHSLAGAGGAPAFAEYFDKNRNRPYERRVLMELGQHFRRFNLHADAIATDELSLQRYPLHPDALLSAQRLAESYQRSNQPERAREAQLAQAPRFAPGSAWATAQTSDSVRTAGATYARTCWKDLAYYHHREAREKSSREDWKQALDLYETVLAHFPDDPDTPSLRLAAGEASMQLGEHAKALAHYAAAESGPDSIAVQAMWQRVAVTDAWYESTRRAGASGSSPAAPSALGSDSLAKAVIDASDRLLARFPQHPKAADLTWREGNLAFAHGWYDRAAKDFQNMATRHPADPRAPFAAGLSADALFKIQRYEDAGAAYDAAAAAARRAGIDSLARRASEAVPVCYYKQAEAAVAADSTNHAQHAALFERVATRWPSYEHAHLAQYRAGLAYLAAGDKRQGLLALQTLIDKFPNSEYVKDAHLQIAKTYEADGQREKAAEAYARFADRYPADESAKDAVLKAADLFGAAGLTERADDLRLGYIKKYPDDVETAMVILEGMAGRELDTVKPEHPVSMLLGPQKAPSSSHLAAYLKLAEANPKLASRTVMARVRFLEGEEANGPYQAMRLTLPLKASIASKRKLLDDVMARYKKSVDVGDTLWSHAAAYRIGQALVAFGEALDKSERPADLHGDDLLAYEDVLMGQAQGFYDRGEGVWSELLRTKGRGEHPDDWILQTRGSLWKRLANRFFYRPEAEFPLVSATAPPKLHPAKKQAAASIPTSDTSQGGAERTTGAADTRADARPEGGR